MVTEHEEMISLHTMYLFVPITRPPRPTPLRCSAYEGGTPLAGPDRDPDGWHCIPPFRINGKLLNRRKVVVVCSVSAHSKPSPSIYIDLNH
jgi:hypothetical protein